MHQVRSGVCNSDAVFQLRMMLSETRYRGRPSRSCGVVSVNPFDVTQPTGLTRCCGPLILSQTNFLRMNSPWSMRWREISRKLRLSKVAPERIHRETDGQDPGSFACTGNVPARGNLQIWNSSWALVVEFPTRNIFTGMSQTGDERFKKSTTYCVESMGNLQLHEHFI